MQLGLVGLGRMGGNMRERLRRAGHEVVGYDHHAEVSDVATMQELVDKLAAPRVVWVMVPAQVTEQTIDEVAQLLSSTAATPGSATTRRGPSAWASAASATWTAGSPAASGASSTGTG
jgi:6-phosphogluconate dehydrogenase (decarboxylating)